MSNRHEFALYYADVSHATQHTIAITDPQIMHRVTAVLRLEIEDSIILFDQRKHTRARLVAIEKKKIMIAVEDLQTNKTLTPTITVLLPLLRREALSEAIYSCVELGANAIQLVVTRKAQRSWGGQKELEHLKKVMIAAAEQSKHFAFPQIDEPKTIDELSLSGKLIFFDPAGESLPEVANQLGSRNLVIMIGPEGDLTEEEKEHLKGKGFVFCALTPTVLRAQQAVAVGLGALRALEHKKAAGF